MPQGRVFTFDDPDRFQATIRAGNYEMLATSKGIFRAGLTRIDFVNPDARAIDVLLKGKKAAAR